MSYGPAEKYPDEVRDFSLDWTKALGTKRLQSSTWLSTSGLTIVDSDFTPLMTTVRVSGGSAGVTHVLENTVVWDDGQTRQVELTVNILIDRVS